MSEVIVTDRIKDKSSYSLTANMFIAFIITYAAGAICFESFMPEKFVTIYSAVIISLCFATWLLLSFISGKNMKWQFVVFSAIFWVLPQVIIFLAESGPEFFRKSIIMYLLSEFAMIFVAAPVEAAGSLINVRVIPFTAIIVLMCVFSFLGGSLFIEEETEYDE